MTTAGDVYALRAPTVTTCPGPIWGFPSQLHPSTPPPPTTGGVGGSRGLRSYQDRNKFRTPRDDWMREKRLREEEDIAVLIALGVL